MSSSTPSQRATGWLQAFGAALASDQPAQASALFDSDSYWRDLVAFTWNIRTQEGPAAIADMLAARAADTAASNFAVEGEATEADGVVDAWFTFETRVARGRGHLRLKATPAGDRAWTLLTTMTELKGFEEKKGPRRIAGAEHGVHRHRKSWAELRQEEQARLGYEEQPYVVIIGGGQGGIMLAARLRRTYRALDLRCTHQGVTVGKNGAAWLCPAHGSQFAGNGTVTGGPAQRSLATVPSTFADGRLTVG